MGGLDRGTVDDACTKTISWSPLTPGTGLILSTKDGLLEMKTSRMLLALRGNELALTEHRRKYFTSFYTYIRRHDLEINDLAIYS